MKHLLPIVALLLVSSAPAQYPTGSGIGPQQKGRTPVAHYMTATSHSAIPPATDRGTAPMNDNCADATLLTLLPFGSCPGMAISEDNSLATQDAGDPTCDTSTGEYLDVWYTFNTGSEQAVRISFQTIGSYEPFGWVIYDECGGNIQYCTVVPLLPEIVNLNTNTGYVLRVYANTQYGPGGEFTLCVEAAPPPPANDLCTGTPPQNLSVGGTLAYTGNSADAQNTEGLNFSSLWHAVTLAECADVTIDLCGSPVVFHGYFRGIWTTCPISSTIIWAGSYNTSECPDGDPTLCFANLPAGTYYVPVASYGGDGPYELHITADVCGTHRAINDECAGAVSVPVGTWCNAQHFSPACATQSLAAIDCNLGPNVANDDVWYVFSATQADMAIGVQPSTAQGTFFPVVEAFSGPCTALVPMACGDNGDPIIGGNAELALTGLEIGTTYFFRVYNAWFGTPLDDAGYDLCVVEGAGINLGVSGSFSTAAVGTIYPNPSTGDFTVRVHPGSRQVSISLIDATGRVVVAKQRPANGGFVNMHTSGSLLPGLYVVRVDDGTSIQTDRLIIR